MATIQVFAGILQGRICEAKNSLRSDSLWPSPSVNGFTRLRFNGNEKQDNPFRDLLLLCKNAFEYIVDILQVIVKVERLIDLVFREQFHKLTV